MFKHLKIGKKLFITYILIAIIASVGGIIGLSVMTNMNTRYDNALQNYGFSQGDIGTFSAEFNHNGSILMKAVDNDNLMDVQTNFSQYETSKVNINSYLAKMEKNMVTDSEKKQFSVIKNDLAQYLNSSGQVMQLAQQNKDDEAGKILNEQCMPLIDSITSNVSQLITSKTGLGNQEAKELDVQQRTATIFMLGIILLSIIVSIFIATAISRGISKPVNQVAKAAEQLAEGNLDVKTDVRSGDEIGDLGASFEKTVGSLRAYIDDIKHNLLKVANGDLNISPEVEFKGDFVELRDSIMKIVGSFNDALVLIGQASEQIAVGSNQVSNSAQALAQGATEQASSVEELTATIEEISSHVKNNAEHAANVSRDVSHVTEEIEASNKLMSEMTEAMSNINQSSGEIRKIIKTIDDIAFQTNILALNAAVEAARAGSAGKGFAVVADEVRNLASKSAEAAKNTTALIENSVRQVENGNKIADVTAASLVRVMDSAKSATETVLQISESSNRQSAAITQVVSGVEQISTVVQTNSATAEESAAASEELSGQALALQTLLGKFKLRDQNNDMADSEPVGENGAGSEPADESFYEPSDLPEFQNHLDPIAYKY